MGCGGSKGTATTSQRRPPPGRKTGRKPGGRGSQTPRKQQKQHPPVNEKGYKKRIRENLRDASAGSDIDHLKKCMEIFENNHMVDGGDYCEAERRMEFLLLKKDIRDACLRHNKEVLEKAITKVEASNYKRQLKPYLDRAYYLKQHQVELDKFQHDISDLDQSTISEIRSYHHPPPGVHETMVATYMVLGYPEQHLTDWTEITALMGRYGKDSLLREVAQAEQKKVDNDTALRARAYLGQYSIEEIRTVSNGAAAFHLWSSRMVGYDGKKNKGGGAKTLTNSGRNQGSKTGTPANQTRGGTGQEKSKPNTAQDKNNPKGQKQQQNTAKKQQGTDNKKSTANTNATTNANTNKNIKNASNTNTQNAKNAAKNQTANAKPVATKKG